MIAVTVHVDRLLPVHDIDRRPKTPTSKTIGGPIAPRARNEHSALKARNVTAAGKTNAEDAMRTTTRDEARPMAQAGRNTTC